MQYPANWQSNFLSRDLFERIARPQNIKKFFTRCPGEMTFSEVS